MCRWSPLSGRGVGGQNVRDNEKLSGSCSTKMSVSFVVFHFNGPTAEGRRVSQGHVHKEPPASFHCLLALLLLIFHCSASKFYGHRKYQLFLALCHLHRRIIRGVYRSHRTLPSIHPSGRIQIVGECLQL